MRLLGVSVPLIAMATVHKTIDLMVFIVSLELTIILNFFLSLLYLLPATWAYW